MRASLLRLSPTTTPALLSRRYELPGCDVPPKLWSALPPGSGVQGDVLQPPSPATTGEMCVTHFFGEVKGLVLVLF